MDGSNTQTNEPREGHGPVIVIEIANHQNTLPVKKALLERAIRSLLEEALIERAEVSVAVVDDPTIHQLNRQYLGHDDATDVLSFTLERDDDHLEGEVIVSADTACRQARRYGWPAEDELLLYVVHGTLHLVGHDDATAVEREEMRRRERACLARFGREPRWDVVGEEKP